MVHQDSTETSRMPNKHNVIQPRIKLANDVCKRIYIAPSPQAPGARLKPGASKKPLACLHQELRNLQRLKTPKVGKLHVSLISKKEEPKSASFQVARFHNKKIDPNKTLTQRKYSSLFREAGTLVKDVDVD